MEKLGLQGKNIIDSHNIKTGEANRYEYKNLILQNLYTGLFQFMDYTASTPSASLLDLPK